MHIVKQRGNMKRMKVGDRPVVMIKSQKGVGEDVYERPAADFGTRYYVRQESNIDGYVAWLTAGKDNKTCPSLTFGGYEAIGAVREGLTFITDDGNETTIEGGFAKKAFPFSWEKNNK
jgi:hypothetical protein